jgi:phage gpG-like protein
MIRIEPFIQTPQGGEMSRRLQQIQQALEGRDRAVKVGLPRGNSPRDLVQIAIWNHFGTRGSGKGFIRNGIAGFGRPIPARPFITLAIWNNRVQLRAQIRAIAVGIIERGENPRVGLGRLGLYAAGLIQHQIAQGVPPPNSELTVRMKGSSRPLIDTGRLRGSITWDYA